MTLWLPQWRVKIPRAARRACSPQDPYALAEEVSDSERDMWIVMAACEG